MTEINKSNSKIAEKLFNQKLRETALPPMGDSSDDDDTMLGYSIIRNIEALNIEEIYFGELLASTSYSIEKAMKIANQTIDTSFAYHLLGKEGGDVVAGLLSASSYAEILQIGEDVSHKSDEIKNLSRSIYSHSDELKKYVADLDQLIVKNKHSNDLKIQMRLNMLNQVLQFQQLRIKTLENHLDISKSTLENASNFLSFTLPTLTYNLQAKISNFDVAYAIKKYDTLKSDFEKKINYRNVISALFSSFGTSIFLISYYVLSLFNGFKNVSGTLFLICLIFAFISFLSLMGDIGDLKVRKDADKNAQLHLSPKRSFVLGFSFVGLVVTTLDIWFVNYKLISSSSTFFTTGLVFFIFSLIAYISIDVKSRNSKRFFDQIDSSLYQLRLLNEQYQKK